MSEDVLDRLERDLALPVYRPTREVVAALIAVARAARVVREDGPAFHVLEHWRSLRDALEVLDGVVTRTESVSSSSPGAGSHRCDA